MDSAEERQQLPSLIKFKNQGPMAEVGRVVTV